MSDVVKFVFLEHIASIPGEREQAFRIFICQGSDIYNRVIVEIIEVPKLANVTSLVHYFDGVECTASSLSGDLTSLRRPMTKRTIVKVLTGLLAGAPSHTVELTDHEWQMVMAAMNACTPTGGSSARNELGRKILDQLPDNFDVPDKMTVACIVNVLDELKAQVLS